MDEKIMIVITTSSEDEALRIARTLVEERLVACAQLIGQIRSLYRWKGAICDDRETMLFCKSRGDLFPAVLSRVKSLHSYEVPEIVAIPLRDGYPPYFRWIEEETEGKGA